MRSAQRGAAALLVATGLLSPVAPARAETRTVVSAAFRYAPPDVTIAPGDGLELLNVDPEPHNVTSLTTTPSGALLFASDNATAGQRVTVRGVERLKPGSYAYFCTIHEDMRGTITVAAGAAGPVPALPGFVSVPAGSVASPTSVTYFDGALYVASYATGEVSRLPVLAGGLLGPATAYATGFDQPLGLAFAPDGTLFVSDSHAIGTGRVGQVRAVPKGGGPNAAVVIDGLPNGRHATNGLAVRAGRLYVANGNNTDDGTGVPAEQPLSGTVLSVPVTARNVPLAKVTVEARGLRNPYDLAFRPGTAELWFPTNGPDAQDPFGEDLLHKVDVRSGAADYGFPACVWKAGPTAGPRCTSKHRRPETTLGLHVSADGIAFAPSTGGWHGEAFVAEYGSNPGETTAGHQVVRIPVVNGRAGAPQQVVALPSPLDLTFGPDGLYVADFGSGQILLLRPEG